MEVRSAQDLPIDVFHVLDRELEQPGFHHRSCDGRVLADRGQALHFDLQQLEALRRKFRHVCQDLREAFRHECWKVVVEDPRQRVAGPAQPDQRQSDPPAPRGSRSDRIQTAEGGMAISTPMRTAAFDTANCRLLLKLSGLSRQYTFIVGLLSLRYRVKGMPLSCH